MRISSLKTGHLRFRSIVSIFVTTMMFFFPLLTELGAAQSLSESEALKQTEKTGVIEPTEPLEEPIDPDEYYVGPGDVLSINLWGELGTSFTSSISPEGTIIIPTVGEISLKGLTLAGAKQVIAEGVLNRYRNTEVGITLVSTRVFKVSVAGAVYDPGVFNAHAVDRVSSVLEKAGGLIGYWDVETMTPIPEYFRQEKLSDLHYRYMQTRRELSQQPSDKAKGQTRASKRNIILKRRDGDSITVDLLKYERTGCLECNPTVLDGDVIIVPVVQEDISECGIFGAVKAPGFYEFAQGDRASDLINIAHGLTLNADTSGGSLIRFAPDGITTRKIKLNLKGIGLNPGGIDDPVLKPDDRIFIKMITPYHKKMQVAIEGEVNYPGTYWIEGDSVYLSEILERAGNPTIFADLRRAEMVRQLGERGDDPEFERLKRMQVADMTNSEYEYFKMRSREKPGRVSLNLEKLFFENDSTHDILLRNGDVITIPRRVETISVTGEVINPGLVTYIEDADVEYYIRKAGGFTQNARAGKTRIIKGVSGEWVKPGRRYPLKPGDTIWVPEKPEIDYWQIIKDALIFTGNLATVYLVVRQATK